MRRLKASVTHQHSQTRKGKQLLPLLDVPGALAGLADLNLDSCALETLPESVGRLTHLRTLSLYDNALTRLPEAVWQLDRLTTLNLAANRFETVPEGIGAGSLGCRCSTWGTINWTRCPNPWAA